MKNIRIKLFAIIALALLAGCSKVGNEDRNETKDGGYFVLNSGNINVNNSNISVFDINKSYFFLARNKKFFKYYENWCRKNGIPYKIKGVPIFSETDKFEYR